MKRIFSILLVMTTCLLAIQTHAATPSGGKSQITSEPANVEAKGEVHVAAAGQKDVQEELGKILPYWSVLPFVAILLAIALIPLFLAKWWESNLNKSVMSLLCSLPILGYLVWIGPLGMEVLADILRDYYAFIILLFALFTISGGIYVEGNMKATPIVNTAFLGLGSLLASFIGTTGATMLLIRPLLKTNRERKHKTHIFIFLTFLVANIGGSLLPVGDPPLFLGYLFGVPFFWTLRLWPMWLTEVSLLLIVFYIWDSHAYSKESTEDLQRDIRQQRELKIHGQLNLLLLIGVLFSVVFLRSYQVGETTINLAWMQQPALILLSLISFTHDIRKKQKAHRGGHAHFKAPREHNEFTFNAIIEVAVLFIGIFITMTPAICLLKAHGAETGVTHAWQFFWMSGALSSFLDNAPTYATYFALGQGVTKGLLTTTPSLPVIVANGVAIGENILMAISVGCVFMGANSYIGNAPNFMVKSICEEAKVKMPSFFGYMIYSGLILIPSFLLIMYIYFL